MANSRRLKYLRPRKSHGAGGYMHSTRPVRRPWVGFARPSPRQRIQVLVEWNPGKTAHRVPGAHGLLAPPLTVDTRVARCAGP